MQEELGNGKASGWKDLWALCSSGTGVGDPSLCWRGESGREQGLRDTLVTAGHLLLDVQGRKGEEAQPCQSRASD